MKKLIVEGLIECDVAEQEIKVEKCSLCLEQGVYRYAPYDFESNWHERPRWRCWKHGKQYADDPEWDYIGDI